MAKKQNYYEEPEKTDSHETTAEYLNEEPKQTEPAADPEQQKPKKKDGRPKKSAEEKKNMHISVAVTRKNYEKIAEAAQRSGRSLNNFIEYTLLNAIEKEGL